MQRKPSDFDDIEFSALKWVEDSIFDDDLDNMFAAEYEWFLMDDGLEYDVFEFDDLCFAADCLLATISQSVTESLSPFYCS